METKKTVIHRLTVNNMKRILCFNSAAPEILDTLVSLPDFAGHDCQNYSFAGICQSCGRRVSREGFALPVRIFPW